MEVQFAASARPYLRPALWEVCSREETQEIRLSDGMPDVGRVICAWGQCILRSKEWNLDHIGCSAGMMVWILYAPDDGSAERVVHSWIPFQLRWELPDGTPEGAVRILCMPKQTDARSVSPRKILVRSTMSALAQALVPETLTVPNAIGEHPDVHLLRQSYPVRLMKETGEKTFMMDETLSLPESAPVMERVIYHTVEPQIQDAKVMTDKLVFRGNARVHMLYRSEEGQLHGWDFSVPFSQYASLEQSYSPDAQQDLMFCVTSLEPEVENGQLRFKCGLVCQYGITDREMLDLVADAYSNSRELSMEQTQAVFYPELERRREMFRPEQTIRADANVAVDVQALPDFPRHRREENGVSLLWPGVFQVLYYGQDGALRSGTARWESEKKLPMDFDTAVYPVPEPVAAQAVPGDGSIALNAEMPVSWSCGARQEIPVVSAVRIGDLRKPDGDRPSLILRRAGEESLWELAKQCGSTVEAIRKVNQLSGEPAERQMLLIPVV